MERLSSRRLLNSSVRGQAMGRLRATVTGARPRLACPREMMWLMPRMSAAVHHPGYVVVEARKPAAVLLEA